MNRKLIIRYVLLCLPFVGGSVLYGLGIFNVVSSLLFFCGGYILLKNLVDYRKIKKNIKRVSDIEKVELKIVDTDRIMENKRELDNEINKNNYYYEFKNNVSISGLKRTNRYERVRKRVKKIK